MNDTLNDIIIHIKNLKLNYELPNKSEGSFKYGYVKACNDIINMINKSTELDSEEEGLTGWSLISKHTNNRHKTNDINNCSNKI